MLWVLILVQGHEPAVQIIGQIIGFVLWLDPVLGAETKGYAQFPCG